MDKVRVLIVDDNVFIRSKLSEFLRRHDGISIIAEASEGNEALAILANTEIDIILLDIVMPKMDGLQMLEEMQKTFTGLISKTIVLTALARDDLIKRVVNLGISYYMVKPINGKTLIAQMQKVIGRPLLSKEQACPIQHTIESINERLSNLLSRIGIPEHMAGYQYLREAIKLVIAKPDVINYIMKELYPEVGRLFATTACNVERDMRNAIQAAWNRGEKDLGKVFGYKAISMEDKPTNKEFILHIVATLNNKGIQRTAFCSDKHDEDMMHSP